MRRLFGRVLRRSLVNWKGLSSPAHFQSITVIQPVDIEPDGRQDMCDGCPDITVHDGRLLWSCRLEEVNAYGDFISLKPAQDTIRGDTP